MDNMDENTGQEPNYMRSYGELTPEKIAQLWEESVKYMTNFYDNVFDTGAYMPVVKDGYEDQLNKIQFYIQASALNGPVSLMWASMFGTQAAFWIGYLEGKNKDKIDLPPGFFEALGEQE